MNIKPLGSNVIIKRDSIETTTASGIILPGADSKEKPAKGLVVAVGDGKINEHGEQEIVQVSVGQRVIFGKYHGHEITVDDEECVVLDQKDIIAILNES